MQLSNVGLKHIADGLAENRTLTCLTLEGNFRTSSTGFTQVFDVLQTKNTTLRLLSIDLINDTTESLVAMLDTNTSLRHLRIWLRSHELTNHNLDKLSSSLSNQRHLLCLCKSFVAAREDLNLRRFAWDI